MSVAMGPSAGDAAWAIQQTDEITRGVLAKLAALSADNGKLKALVAELANDLEDELKGRYGDDIHPAMLRKFNRDMEPVLRARAALEHEQL